MEERMKNAKVSVVLILVGLLFAGPGWIQSAEAAKKRYMIQCGSMGGGTYVMGSIMSKILSKAIPEASFTARTGHGTFSGIPMLEKGELDLLIVGAEGLDAYGSVEIKKRARILAISHGTPQHIIAQKSLNAKSIYDLKGKKVSFSYKGGPQHLVNSNMLTALGLKFEDFSPIYLTPGDTTAAFQNRQIDALVSIGGLPHPTFVECFVTGKGADLIGLSGEDMKKISQKYPYYVKFIVPKETYKDQKQEIATIVATKELYCRDDFPTELAYKITKTLHENYSNMVKLWSGAAGSTAELLVTYATYPFHPGTEKYYREIGLLKK
jgi:uncharacterized protein